MRLDATTKTVSLISAIMAAMISLASFFVNWRLKESDERLRQVKQSVDAADTQTRIAIEQLEANAKVMVAEAQAKAAAAETAAADMKNSQTEFELAARLQVNFGLQLSRAFAINFSAHNQEFAMPTTALTEEFKKVLPGWQERKGLMAGHDCGAEGLLARQVITLEIRNVGVADAENIKVHFLEKPTPRADSAAAWQEMSPEKKPVQYYDVPLDGTGWKHSDMDLRNLPGSHSGNKGNNLLTVVLASVSGGSLFYGTVFVPVEIEWWDKITKRTQTAQIMEPEKPMLRSGLIGAEIGSIRATCK